MNDLSSCQMADSPRLRRIALSAALYFASVFFVAFQLGIFRTLVLEPRLGPTIAVACEMPLLLLTIALAARKAPERFGLSDDRPALVAIGVGALVLQQVADFTLGLTLRGISFAQQLAYLATPAGRLYLAALTIFAGMPLAINYLHRTDFHQD